MSYKKVLFIDGYLHKENATGITLSNLFEQWPKDKLIFICDEKNAKLSNLGGYVGVYELSKKEIQHHFPLNIFRTLKILIKNLLKRGSSNDFINKTDNPKSKVVEQDELRNPNIFYLFTKIFNLLGLNYYFFRYRLSKDLEKWIRESKPEVLYTLAATRHNILFAKEINKKLRIPICIHILDDYPATLGSETVFPKFWNRVINKDLTSIINIAKQRIAISEMMAVEYEARFGGKWEYFHNPISFNFWNKSKKTNYTANSPFTILYSGRLSDGIGFCMEKISECIDELNNEESLNIKLKIQSRQHPKWISKYKDIVFSDYIDYDSLPELFSSSDLLLLPYDFNGHGYQYIRLSMPTKVSEYLASGTPILTISPETTALVNYLRKYDLGYIISEESKMSIKSGIKKLYYQQQLRENIGTRGCEIAKLHHDKVVVQKRFLDAIEKIKL
jgi:hypothetical protein